MALIWARTYTVAARLDDVNRPRTLTNAEGDRLTPSVVLLDEGEVVIGKEAVKAMGTDMERVAEGAKRDVGQRMFHRALGGRRYPPETIEAWVLDKVRRDTWDQIGDYHKVVITVPAYFDEVRRKATQDAGDIAGFEVLDIINEPTAAAVAFGFQQGYLSAERKDQEPRKILVYDLGGGTFDAMLMALRARDCVALATDGDVRLGGAGLLLDKHQGRVPQFQIRNVNSHSLGVVATDPQTKRALNAVLIPRNTPLPAAKKKVFRTQKHGQRSVLVRIVEGEARDPDYCSPIGKCSIRDLPDGLARNTPIEVGFRYLENGRLNIWVKVAGTGKLLRHEILRDNSLTQKQRNGWRKYVSGLPPLAQIVRHGQQSPVQS